MSATNHQWGMGGLKTRRPVATSALARPVRRKTHTDGSFLIYAKGGYFMSGSHGDFGGGFALLLVYSAYHYWFFLHLLKV